MMTFDVNDMTCGHCVSTITNALKAVDDQAKFTVDLTAHQVLVESTRVDPRDLIRAIEKAGYTPVQVGATNHAPQAKSCCAAK